MGADSKLLAAGMRHCRSGDLQQAREVYRQLLAADPQDSEVLNLLGSTCVALGQPSEARGYLQEALRLNPVLAAAHDTMGSLLMAENRFADAVVSFRRAVGIDPRGTAARLNLAGALARCGKIVEAIEMAGRAVQLAPDSVQARAALARLLVDQGGHAEALPHLRHVAQLKPDDAGAHLQLADALARSAHRAESIAAYRAAIRLKPDAAEACVNLANLYFEQKFYDEAVNWSRRAIELRPDMAEAYHNLGVALTQQRACDEAIAAFQTALRLKPELSETYVNLGVALAVQGRFDAAIEQYRRALAMRPVDPDALHNLGNAYMKLGNTSEALEHFNRAVELRPEHGESHLARAVAWLLEGRIVEGLAEYEWRSRVRDFTAYDLLWNPWTGQPLADRTIVLCAEQGFGDTLQFVRYAPLLAQQGARVIVLCNPVLSPILARTPGIDALVTPGMAVVKADYCVPIMSLPHRLGTTLETIPAQVPYVFADSELVEKWRQELSRWEGFRVGIVWQGNPENSNDRVRSFALSHYAPLSQLPGVRLFSLQVGAGTEQLAAVAGSWPIVDFGDRLNKSAASFMNVAAIMRNLDLVVTCDTAAAHLAGALGVNVWVALPMVPDWRWMLNRPDSPWYPTMRLFRQTRLGGWPQVFEHIAGELARVASHPRR